nr:hypothetical protein [Conexibacter arvalis]
MRPHDAGDGRLARVRVPGGLLRADQLDALAAGAALGNGLAELTSRGSVQLRGLPEGACDGGAAGGLARVLAAGGLLPSPAHDRVRNLLASPLAGRHPDSLLDTDPLVAAFDAALCADPALAALPGRFLFALDDGAGLTDIAASDVALVAEARDALGHQPAPARDEAADRDLAGAAADRDVADAAMSNLDGAGGPGASGGLGPAGRAVPASVVLRLHLAGTPTTLTVPAAASLPAAPGATSSAAGASSAPGAAHAVPGSAAAAPGSAAAAPGSAAAASGSAAAAPDSAAAAPGSATAASGSAAAAPGSVAAIPDAAPASLAAVATLLDAARGFLALRDELDPTAWHVADLPDGAARLAAALGGAVNSGRLGVVENPKRPDFAPGRRVQPDGRIALTALAPLGRLDRAQLLGLAALLQETAPTAEAVTPLGGEAARAAAPPARAGAQDDSESACPAEPAAGTWIASALRLSTARTVTLVDLPPDTADAAARELERLGLVVESGSGWEGLTACSGLGACRRALVDVRGAAAVRAARRRAGAPAEHWSACPRRCGMKRDVAIGVVADDGAGGREPSPGSPSPTLTIFRAGGRWRDAADAARALELLDTDTNERPAA